MHLTTRAKALRAAAKVTLSASLFACGGATAQGDAGTGMSHPEGDDDARVATDDAPSGARESGSAALSCTVTDPVSQDTFSCCTGLLGGELGDGGFAFSDAVAASASTHECCSAVISYVNANDQAFEEGYRVARPCCDVVPDSGGAACTPWGPPVPPAMSYLDERMVA
jgi:hypothetical protein